MIKSAYVSHFHSLQGHDPAGAPCGPLEGTRCLKGAVIAVQNAVSRGVALRDIVMDADLLEELSYDVKLSTLKVIPKRASCSRGTRLSRMRSAPGMWAYLDPARGGDDVVPLAGGGGALTSFFLAAEAQPGQAVGGPCFISARLDPMDCCFTTILTAAACKAQLRDSNIFPTTMRGNATLLVDTFNISVHMRQTGVPVTFANDVPNFNMGVVTASCRDFVFH